MSIRKDLQAAYILHARPYRDTSLLLDVLTQYHGRVSLIARGVRKPKNNQRYLLQPFIPLLLSWQGKSQLKTLVGIEARTLSTDAMSPPTATHMLQAHHALLGDRLYSALYVNELLVYLMNQEDPSTQLYDQYELLLQRLQQQQPLEACLRYFEFEVLSELGYGINFFTEAETDQAISADKYYYFITDKGFIDTTNHPHIRDMSYLGADLLALQQGNLDDGNARAAAKNITRTALRPHLRGRKLKSRELFMVQKPNSSST